MEIFNNIWNALCMPNEELLHILTVPLYFVESTILMYLFLMIVNISSTKKQKIIYLISMSIIGIITNQIIPNPFNTFINYFIMIILAYYIFKTPLLKISVSIFLTILIINLIGILISNPFVTIFNITTNDLNSIPIYKLLFISIVYILSTLIIIIIKQKKLNIVFIDNIDKKDKSIIVLNLVLGIIAIIVQAITLFYYLDKIPLIMTFLNFITLLFYFLISIYSLTRIFKLILTTQKLESAEAYNNSLRILHEEIRCFKHDYDNTVTTIGGFVRTNDMEGLKKYYLQLEDDCQRVNNLYVLNPELINNDGIYNLLAKKYNDADSKNIKVNMSFLLDLSELHMKIYDFAKILGILLDNAIEASSECEEKVINILFRNDFKNSRQIISIENTYKDKSINIDKIFDKGVSSKQNHTGLGLWEIRKIIKKYNNINLFTNKDDKFFKQQIEIYY